VQGPNAPRLERRARFAAGLWLLVWAVWLGAGRAHAQPIVRVRAETRIELDVRRDLETLLVRGALRDDAGEPVEGRTISVLVRPEGGTTIASLQPRTDAAGRFEARVTAAPGSYQVEATFVAEPDLVGSSARIVLDRLRAHVVLVVELVGGSRLSLDAMEQEIHVVATSAAGGHALSIEITDEVGTPIAEGTTDGMGRLLTRVPSTSLGPAAAGRLVVRSEGDDTRSPAQTEVPIVRFRATSIRWLDASSELRAGTSLRGRLETATGPLERRAVGVFVDGRHVATRLTGPDGELVVPLDPAMATGPEAEIVARFESDAPWLATAVSDPRRLAVAAPRPRAVPYLVVASAFLAVGVALWLRRRPTSEERATRRSLPGVEQARPASLRAQFRGVTGAVVQASSQRPLAGVTISCGARSTTTGSDGRFVLEVPDGSLVLTAEAPGFETERQRIASPHRGEWLGMVVRLESRRDLAARQVLDVLGPLVPQDLVAVATDRELLRVARTGQRAEVVALVDAAEKVIYGEAPPEAADLEHVRSLAARARAVTARVDSPSMASL
jgi:hypothetical protein